MQGLKQNPGYEVDLTRAVGREANCTVLLRLRGNTHEGSNPSLPALNYRKTFANLGGEMKWNHRIIRERATSEEAELNEEEFFYTIREVYYDDGQPELVTMEGDAPWGTTVDELKQDVEWFSKALGQPVLNYEDF